MVLLFNKKIFRCIFEQSWSIGEELLIALGPKIAQKPHGARQAKDEEQLFKRW